MLPDFLFHPEGDPGQRAVHAEDVRRDGEVQSRAPAPSGSSGEPAGLLQSQTAAAGVGGAGTSHRAAGQAVGGTLKKIFCSGAKHKSKVILCCCYLKIVLKIIFTIF